MQAAWRERSLRSYTRTAPHRDHRQLRSCWRLEFESKRRHADSKCCPPAWFRPSQVDCVATGTQDKCLAKAHCVWAGACYVASGTANQCSESECIYAPRGTCAPKREAEKCRLRSGVDPTYARNCELAPNQHFCQALEEWCEWTGNAGPPVILMRGCQVLPLCARSLPSLCAHVLFTPPHLKAACREHGMMIWPVITSLLIALAWSRPVKLVRS